MLKFIGVYLIFFTYLSYGQNNFRSLDSLAKTIKYKGSLNQLVQDLTNQLDSDLDKTRAMYSWITENIEYDYKIYNKEKKPIIFKCNSKSDCQIKIQEYERNLIDKVLQKKKGVCSGYSILFQYMCNIAKINCLRIDGYVKTKPTHIGNSGILDHSWNAVIIDSQIYFLDLKWASGYCEINEDDKLINFVKERNDFYWFTPIQKLTINHFPKNPEKIPNFNISKEDYKNQPYIKNKVVPLIDIETPLTGIITSKVKDSIVFKFKYSNNIDKIQVNTNIKRNPKIYSVDKKGQRTFNQKAFDKQVYIPYKKQNDEYEITYIVEDENLRYIEILFDYDLKLKYLIKIE